MLEKRTRFSFCKIKPLVGSRFWLSALSRLRFSTLSFVELLDQVDPPFRQWLFGHSIEALVQRRP